MPTLRSTTAKGKGRGTYHFFEAAMDAQMRARRELESDLRKAVGADEFELTTSRRSISDQ